MDVSISAVSLQQSLGDFPPPLIISVGHEAVPSACDRMLAGSIRRDPGQVEEWAADLEIGRPITVYGRRGCGESEDVAAALRRRGFVARFLVGGLDSWVDHRFPVQPRQEAPPTTWVTRERPKVDRIACPWLIRRFVDPLAVFLFVSPSEVVDAADRFGATPFDIEATFWSHRGKHCTFDVMVEEFGLSSEPLARLAAIVRGADTDRLDIAPQAAGLLAASLGLSRMYRNDLEQLEASMVLYDALYRWARDAVGEAHDWPMPTPGGGRS
jgi:rhodanese-related sulfurtransferase